VPQEINETPVDMLCGMGRVQVTDGIEVGEYMAKQSRILQEAYSYVCPRYDEIASG